MEYIKITLESDLCVASGESGGNTVDSDICVDTYGLPYIPARRIKGCLRQAAEELQALGYPDADSEKIRELFGDPFGNEGAIRVLDGNMEGADCLRERLRQIRVNKNENAAMKRAAHPVNVERLFSEVHGSTKMQDGVKVDNTLRFTRVLKQYDPLEAEPKKLVFTAPIFMDDEKRKGLLRASCSAMRHIGLNRNRGLGDVRVEYVHSDEVMEKSEKPEEQMQKLYSEVDQCNDGQDITITYTVMLAEPVSIPGLGEYETSIPGRSVIGCMSGEYLKTHEPDDRFTSLFLNGDVRWSFLTPMIGERFSNPVPFMLMKLKNGGGRIINCYTQESRHWMGQKPKTMGGSYAARTENGYIVAEPILHMFFHHSIQKSQLYMQNALEDGMIYGGSVVIHDGDKELAKEVSRLLLTARLGFGRSKGAQYAACKLRDIHINRQAASEDVSIEKGMPVLAVFESDAVINDNGIYITKNREVRRYIAGMLSSNTGSILWEESGNATEEKDPLCPQGFSDTCQYKTTGGYQVMWQLQKPHIPAVGAGSVYCFVSGGGKIPRYLSVGEYAQEGYGRCRIYSLEELMHLQEIDKGDVDRATYEGLSDCANRLETAMRVFLAEDVLRRYAREYYVKDRNVPVSRLRLMLSEASDYADLLKRVSTMKTSDRSSVNEKGKRTITEELLRDFYGPVDTEPLEKILGTDQELYQELSKDRKAMEEIGKMWKLPLDQLLHNMHYTKGR